MKTTKLSGSESHDKHFQGIPDERMGEEVGAFLRLKNNTKLMTRDEVQAFCQGKMSHFKIPRYIVIVDEFPKTLTGKIQKFKFLETFSKQIDENKKSLIT